MQAPTEDKCYDTKHSFYLKLECVFDQFPKYSMNMLLEDFNAELGWEDLSKPTTGNASLYVGMGRS
jgi:hypothetical protein